MRSFSIPWVYKLASNSAPLTKTEALEVLEIAKMAKSSIPTPSQQLGTMGPIGRSSTLTPDMTTYFLVRRNSKKDPVGSASTGVSPRFGEGGSGTYSKSPKSGQSREFNRSNRETEPYSIESSVSVASQQNRNVRDWNEKRWSDPVTNPNKSYRRHPLDPPRPAKDGMEWVWFPEGYWAEREIRSLPAKPTKRTSIKRLFKRPTDQRTTSSQSNSTSTKTPTKSTILRIEIGSLKSMKSSSRGSPTKINNAYPDEGQGDQDSNKLSSSSSTLPPLGGGSGPHCRVIKTLASRFAKSNAVKFERAPHAVQS
jgi:hypothetical protein